MEEKLREIFAKRLKFYMDIHHMNQADLARKMEVSETTASNWTRGIKVPRADMIDKLCYIFNCKRSDLLEEPTAETMSPLLQEHIKLYSQLQPEFRSLIDDLIKAAQEEPRDEKKILELTIEIATILRS